MVPMNGVVQYSHKSVVTPDTMAGDNDLIGFIAVSYTHLTLPTKRIV